MNENQEPNMHEAMYSQPIKQNRGLSTGAAIALGLSAIIVTAIIVGGIIILRGVDVLETLDINVSGEIAQGQEGVTNINWQNIPSDDIVALVQGADIDVMLEQPISLSTSIDLTGDGVEDAVFNGIGGNAGVSFILINDNGQPIIAQQRDESGRISPVALEQVGRAAVAMGYELLPAENGYYILERGLDQSQDNSEFSNFVCEALDVYVWNESMRLFEWNQQLSDQYYTQECS
ncbi:MAG: hypothetical protein KBC22_01655 [Candidatus Pacebacteria bacterium]|nr:hypothetical protein [Candidatus Paceibacterota bacterium]